MKSKLFEVFKNILLLSSTLLFLFIAYIYFVIPYKIIQQGGESQRVVTNGDDIIRFDNQLGFIANENSTSERYHQKINLKYKVTTDETGARVKNNSQKFSNESNSITAIGGSFAWGHGLNYEQTYSNILEEKLNVKVKNYAMAGYGTLQSYRILKKKKTNSNLIIYGFIDDHINRNVMSCAHTYGIYCIKAPIVKIDRENKFYITNKIKIDNVTKMKNYSKRLKTQKLFALENFKLGFAYSRDSLARRLQLNENNLILSEKLDVGEYLIKKLNNHAKMLESKLLIVNVGIGQPNDNFETISKRSFDNNLFFLDASSFDTPSKDLLIEIDNHPNSLGHLMIANKIYKFIEDNNLLN